MVGRLLSFWEDLFSGARNFDFAQLPGTLGRHVPTWALPGLHGAMNRHESSKVQSSMENTLM